MAEKILAAPKMVSFSHLPAVKKETIFGAARKIFWPFLFCDGFSFGSFAAAKPTLVFLTS